MSTQLTRLADSLILLSTRLRAEAASDDGSLQAKFGGAISELMLLREVVAARLAANDARTDQLRRVDAALSDLAVTFAALPPPAPAAAPVSRPVQRRRELRASRLDASTRRLLRRAALVLGIGSGLGIPLMALADSCTGTTSVVCAGSFAGGISLGSPTLTALVQSLTANIAPASGTAGITLDGAGSEGSHDGAGANGDPGGVGPDLVLNSKDTGHQIITTGASAFGIAVRSSGGGAGNGGGGIVAVEGGGDGGRGGDGGSVLIFNATGISTGGDYAAGIYALSHGGQGGAGGDSNGGPSAGTGGPGGDAGSVSLTNSGKIATSGLQAHGLYAASIGGNGGSGGGGFVWSSGGDGGVANVGSDVTIINNAGGDIVTTGVNAIGIYGESIGGFGGGGGGSAGLFGYGGGGSLGGDAGTVTITNHASVTTKGADAYAIFGQSVGGGGGNGGSGAGIVGLGASGSVGGKGSDVSITNSGTLDTTGDGARGIFAQSVGGGGGNGGSGAGIAGVGGSGSGTSPGGNVLISNSGNITTRGTYAYALEAQSVGGGGGDGGMSIGIISIGGSGGSGGDAGTVKLDNSGILATGGADASAVFAQSVGGGGGNGGNSVAAGAFISLALGGSAGPGGKAAAVTVSSITGSITTLGARASGIFAQSIGGGGGNGGFAISASAGPDFSVSVGVGGQGSGGGKGSTVGVTNASAITTSGDNSYGIFAQSVGGGGGNGGLAIAASASDGVSGAFAVGGHAGGGGDSDVVTVLNTGLIITKGDQADGILAQSVGGGGGNGGLAISGAVGIGGALGFSIGGDGGSGGNGAQVSLTNKAGVTTSGDFSTGLLAQSVGGGGGNGGGAISGSFSQSASFSVGVGGSGDTGGFAQSVVLANDGAIATTGDNALGVVAQSIGGGGGNGGFSITGTLSGGYAAGISVGGKGNGGGAGGSVNLSGGGGVTTSGFKSIGMLAQSVGGGGGNGGFSIAGTIAQNAAATFAIGGSAGGGGTGGKVLVNTSSSITTLGDLAYGILAQSVGGGGGTGGFAVSGQASSGSTVGGVSLALGGTGGPGRDGGTVDLTSGGVITTSGQGAHGIIGQSGGGGGGDGGFAGSFLATIGDGATANFGVGGNGGTGGSGDIVHVTTSGTVITSGQGAYGVLAQSVGGGGGDGGWGMAITGSAATESKGTLVGSIGGNGGTGGLGSAVFLNNTANVTTLGSNAYGLVAQSIGGGGGDGGFSASGAFTTGTNPKTLSIGVGGQGGSGNNAGKVTLTNSGKISTTGNTVNLTGTTTDNSLDKKNAIGILAQSVGGGGGNGGASFSGTIGGPDAKTLALNVGGFGGAGGTGGEISLTNLLGGDIETEGSFGYGIEAQSVGGGGGNGGMALAAIFGVGGEGTNANIGVTLGGQGGDGNTASLVTVNNAAGITTRGEQSAAILAQSIGGGGGAGGAAITAIMGVSSVDPNQAKSRTVNVAVAVGGLGGNGSDGGVVSVINSGALTTWADQSQGIKAQSIGGGGGDGGNSNTISLIVGAKCSAPLVCTGSDNAARNLNLQASVGGNGGGASDGNTVTVNNSGIIVTHGEMSDGIFAQSIGGGGGNGGNGSLGTGGLLPFPATLLFLPVGAVKIYQDISVAVGGNSGSQGNGAAVTVTNTAAITTSGGNAMAINAQSVGGGGGTGGIASIGITGKVGIGGKGGAGGDGGTVSVTNKALLTTSGVASYGIFAQSVGGGGGRAGNVNRGFASLTGGQYAFGIGLAFGQGGGNGGNGAGVTVDNSAGITTTGQGAIGLFAQSVGGGGGQLGDIGNGNINGILGGFVGSVGDKGNGGAVSVTQSGNVSTQGSGAAGVFAQSAGGQGTGDQITVKLTGNITTMGSEASGLVAQSVGLNGAGNLSVTDQGNITTSGDKSTGMTVQSFGAASAVGTVVTPIATQAFILPFLTGMAKAGSITINQTGTTITSGANAHGILAQSVSSLGSGGAISITYNGSITASGMDADGIVAQSTGVAADPAHTPTPFPNLLATAVADNGNIAITINGQGTVSGGLGAGAAVRFIDGNNNTLVNYGTLTTAKGLSGITVVGGSGNETFDNYGTFVGLFDLGGGVNAFHNHVGATIVPGTTINLGGPGEVLDNGGTLSPGGAGTVQTTNLNGSLSQSTGGTLLVDLDLKTLTADRINATGTASLGGALTLNLDNIQAIKPGTTTLTILSAAGGATNNGLHLTNPSSAVAQYTLKFANPTDAVVTLAVNFAPTGAATNANDTAIGNYFNALQLAGSSAALAPTIQAVFALPDVQSLHNFYQTLSPAPFLAGQYAIAQTGSNLTDSMLSCHPQWGAAWRFTEETECSWLRFSPRSTRIEHTAAGMGSNSRGVDITAGHQFLLDDETFRLGLAGSFSSNDSSVENYAATHGQSFAGGAVLKALFNPVEVALAVSGGEATTHTNRFVAPGTVAASQQHDKFINERARVSLQVFGEDDYYARPFAELNTTQLFLGGFKETGAGALDLISASRNHQSGTAGAGIEFGGEIALSDMAVIRPFAGYEFKRTVWGRTLDITAALEGAPAGVAPFTVSTSPDVNLHQASGGVDLIGGAGWSVRALYTGTFGNTTRQDLYSVKVTMPF
ncbi:MAG: Outer rane autotransporter barrel [Alphaproteobacteria bacterium]|nr:Outer rane autotransporter barrel [Alphaproteobacteria bacterium]